MCWSLRCLNTVLAAFPWRINDLGILAVHCWTYRVQCEDGWPMHRPRAACQERLDDLRTDHSQHHFSFQESKITRVMKPPPGESLIAFFLFFPWLQSNDLGVRPIENSMGLTSNYISLASKYRTIIVPGWELKGRERETRQKFSKDAAFAPRFSVLPAPLQKTRRLPRAALLSVTVMGGGGETRARMCACVPLCLCYGDPISPLQRAACRRQAQQQRPLFLFPPLSLSLGRAPPSDEVGGRNINSNSCFLTPAVSLPEHTFFFESPIRGNKRGRVFWGVGVTWEMERLNGWLQPLPSPGATRRPSQPSAAHRAGAK